MTRTIAMETEQVKTVAFTLNQNAKLLDELSLELSAKINRLEINWQGGASRESFFSETAQLKSRLTILTRDLFELYDRLILEIREWENTANRLAGGTRQGVAGIGLAGAAGIGTASAVEVGEVLGVSAPTAGVTAQTYQQLSWNDKFDEEAAINARIGKLEQQLYNLPADRTRALDQIDEDIAYWTKKKAEYETSGEIPPVISIRTWQMMLMPCWLNYRSARSCYRLMLIGRKKSQILIQESLTLKPNKQLLIRLSKQVFLPADSQKGLPWQVAPSLLQRKGIFQLLPSLEI